MCTLGILLCRFASHISEYKRGPWLPNGQQVWHLITGSPLYVGLTCTSCNAEDKSQYNPGC